MKTAAVVCALLLAGLAAGAAFGDILPPAPTLPTTTVSVPPITTPTVTLPVTPPPAPKPPAPAPPPPPTPTVSVPSVTTPSVGATTPTATRPVPSASVSGGPSVGRTSGGRSGGTSGGGGSGGSVGSSGGGSAGSASGGSAFVVGSAATTRSASGSRGVTAARLKVSRPWISTTGPASHHKTTLVFRLRRRAWVVFTVTQIAPECRVAGRFVVKGRRGTNVVRFNGRLHGQALAPGTYRIAAHVAGGRTVLQAVVAIFGSTPTATELANAQRDDVCAASRILASSATLAAGGAAANTGSGASQNPDAASEIVRNQNGASSVGTSSSGTAHVTAAPFSPTRMSKNATNPLVILALALAVVLLGVAALPQEAIPGPRLTDTIARHRLEVALAGGAALTMALLALALA